jgi:hypothetical protein
MHASCAAGKRWRIDRWRCALEYRSTDAMTVFTWRVCCTCGNRWGSGLNTVHLVGVRIPLGRRNLAVGGPYGANESGIGIRGPAQ